MYDHLIKNGIPAERLGYIGKGDYEPIASNSNNDTLLVRLWSVADESTYRLMVRFFEGIKAGKDKMTALRDAKNYLRANGYANPFYRASFTLMGETN